MKPRDVWSECFPAETKVQNLRTGPLDASIIVDENIVYGVTAFALAIISGQNRRRSDNANQT